MIQSFPAWVSTASSYLNSQCLLLSLYRPFFILDKKYISKVNIWFFFSLLFKDPPMVSLCSPFILNISELFKVCRPLAEVLLFPKVLCTTPPVNTCVHPPTCSSYPDQFLLILRVSSKSHFLRKPPLLQFLRFPFHVFSYISELPLAWYSQGFL